MRQGYRAGYYGTSACLILSPVAANALTTSPNIDQLQQAADDANATLAEADYNVNEDFELVWEAGDAVAGCTSFCGDAQQAYQTASDTYNQAVIDDQTAELNAAEAEYDLQTALNGG